jgi:hypothetical protein
MNTMERDGDSKKSHPALERQAHERFSTRNLDGAQIQG